MKTKFRAAFAALSLALALSPLAALAQGFNDNNGKEWRQVTETTGLSWDQVAQACPRDGLTPAVGSINNRTVEGWVWATDNQVAELFSLWAPLILTSPNHSVAGPEYLIPAGYFQSVFSLTAHFKGCPTYQPCFDLRLVEGWVAQPAESNTPLKGSVAVDAEGIFPTAGFSIAPAAGTASPYIGIFMWRPTGLNTGGIYANNDFGYSPSPSGGIALNVLANDWLAGAHPTSATVTVTQFTAAIPGITLLADGSVSVDAGTPAGTYAFGYQISEIANPANSDDALATITVRSYPILAVADQGSVSFAAGGVAVPNVLANDKLGGLPASLSVVSLTEVSSTNSGISLNLATGAVQVSPGTANGTYTLVYKITELANPANSSQTTVTIRPYSIDAVNDYARGSSKTGGTVIASVLANDTFNGVRATTSQVSISLPAPLPKGITLNLTTGAVIVAPKTSSGTYVITYRISEIASPANFDEATITLDLSGRSP